MRSNFFFITVAFFIYSSFPTDIFCCACMCGYDRRCICLYRSKYINEDTFFWLSEITKNLPDVIDMHSIFMLFKHQSTHCRTPLYLPLKKAANLSMVCFESEFLSRELSGGCCYLYSRQFVTSSMLTHIFFLFIRGGRRQNFV